MKSVAIIGCGPSGLLAAHAASQLGMVVSIFSKDVRPSPHAHATFLHSDIPGLTSPAPDGTVEIRKVGDGEGYAQKVYKDRRKTTSWDKLPSGHMNAWSLRPVYRKLWERFGDRVRLSTASPELVRGLQGAYDYVINTVPAAAVCDDIHHKFPSEPIWVVEGQGNRVIGSNESYMLYNGNPRTLWYRQSNIFGVISTEFANPVKGASRGIKVLPTDCDCHPELIRVGRWGTWMPGVLLHSAYWNTKNALVVKESNALL